MFDVLTQPILIVDDERVVRDVSRRTLAREGYAVVSASDGKQALELFARHRVRLVVADLFMPGMSGMEFIQEVRRRSPDIKVLAMSGGGQIGEVDVLEFARKLGADDVLAKPFGPEDLIVAVEDLLHPGDEAA